VPLPTPGTRHQGAQLLSSAPPGPPYLTNTPSWAMEGPCPCLPPCPYHYGTWVPSSAPGGSSFLQTASIPSFPPSPTPPPMCFALLHYVTALTDGH